MKKGQFTAEQIVAILREAEKNERTVGEICRANGIAEATFYRWRRQYHGVEALEVKELRDLRTENGRLKRLLADRVLEVDALQSVLLKK